jgi:hypothetical protein
MVVVSHCKRVHCLLASALLSVGCTYDFGDAAGGAGQSGKTASQSSAGGATASSTVASTSSGPACSGPSDPTCNDMNPCTIDACVDGSCKNSALGDGLAPGYVDNPGDCVDDICKGGVLFKGAPDNTEIPDDNNICTSDSCSGGMPMHVPALAQNGMGCGGIQICEDGDCVGCDLGSDCAGADTFCRIRTCSSSHVCGTMNQNEGVATPTGQTSGDCHTIVCIAGLATSQNSDDPQSDGKVCTQDVCSNGSTIYAPEPPTFTCGAPAGCVTMTSQKVADHCDGAGNCTAGSTSACQPKYGCSNGMCNTSCNTIAECAFGFTCNNHVCQ